MAGTSSNDGRTPAVLISIAHLDDEERMLALGVIFDELLSYTRSLSGTNRLRALFMVEECVGMPPHPGNPPTKRPLVRLVKQGWFLTRNVHQSPSVTLVQPRLALSYMRGPMTLSDIKRALERKQGVGFGHGLTPTRLAPLLRMAISMASVERRV